MYTFWTGRASVEGCVRSSVRMLYVPKTAMDCSAVSPRGMRVGEPILLPREYGLSV